MTEYAQLHEKVTNWAGDNATVAMAGIPTFIKAPYVFPIKEELRKKNVKVAFIGVPFESGNFSRPGSSWGPRGLRVASEQFTSYLFSYDVDLFEKYNLVDCGDVPVVPPDIDKTHILIERDVLEILKAGALPVIVGGDHSLPIGSARAFSKTVKGKMGYIQFDTHMDTAETVGGSRVTSCSPVSRTSELPNVDPKNVVLVGPHGSLNPREWLDYIKRRGIQMLTMKDVCDRGIKEVTKEALELAWDGTESVYVSFDTDSVDAAFAPGTSAPEPGGFTSREIIEAIRLIGKTPIGAFDVVELCPAYDLSGITARLCCYVILELLGTRATASL